VLDSTGWQVVVSVLVSCTCAAAWQEPFIQLVCMLSGLLLYFAVISHPPEHCQQSVRNNAPEQHYQPLITEFRLNWNHQRRLSTIKGEVTQGDSSLGNLLHDLAILCPGLRLITHIYPASTYQLAQQSL